MNRNLVSTAPAAANPRLVSRIALELFMTSQHIRKHEKANIPMIDLLAGNSSSNVCLFRDFWRKNPLSAIKVPKSN